MQTVQGSLSLVRTADSVWAEGDPHGKEDLRGRLVTCLLLIDLKHILLPLCPKGQSLSQRGLCIICDTSYNADSWVPPHTDCIKLSVNVTFCFAFCVPFPRSPKECLGSSSSLPFINHLLPWITLNIIKLPRSCHV